MVVNNADKKRRSRAEFSFRLKEALATAGYEAKQRPLSEKYGVKSESARKWLSGGSIPEHGIIKRLASDCNVNPQWLEYGEGPRRRSDLGGESDKTAPIYVTQDEFVHKVPLLTWKGIDDWLDRGSGLGGKYRSSIRQISVINAPNERCFALTLRDDSMQSSIGPSLANGYIVIIDPEEKPKDRQVILVKTNDGHVVRKLELTSKLLTPFNQRYPIVVLSGQIIGVVIDCFVGDISSIIN